MEDYEILFVDDDAGILAIASEYLLNHGYRVTVCDRAEKAIQLLENNVFEIVFTDFRMPELNGIELLKIIKKKWVETEVVMITGHASIDSAIKAIKLGSYDYIRKPIKLELLKILIDRIFEKKKLQQENRLIKKRLQERNNKDGYGYDRLIGVSPKMQDIYERIDRISMNSPTVLIHGESGTGKEMVAHVVHDNSIRKDMPFIPVNCGAISEGLLESELFGHVKGAFTGAIRENIGLFRASDKGSIFLDEIAEISPATQVKLLRVLQDKMVRPVGGTKETKVDVRVIAATNRDLEEAIKSGALRKDLYYRLNVVSIKIPPLNERKEDIPLLINHFLQEFNLNRNDQIKGISSTAMDLLLNYYWPGNVRELENVIERAFALGVKGIINLDDLPSEIKTVKKSSIMQIGSYSLKENEIMLIRNALIETDYNKVEAAQLLEIDTSTLYRKLKRYDILFDSSHNAKN